MGQILARQRVRRRSNSIYAVPPEILVRVFEYLDVRGKGRVAQVCRTWRDVARLPSVWKDVEVNRLSPASIFDDYLRCGICRIMLDANRFNSQKLAEEINEFLSHRRRFGVRTTGEVEIGLTVSGERGNNSISGSQIVALLRASSGALRSLKFVECEINFFHIVTAIRDECENVAELSFQFYSDVLSEFSVIDSYCFAAAVRDMRRLRRLQLELCSFNGTTCAFLQFLDQLSFNGFVDVRRTSLPLRSLHVRNDRNITNASLKYISRSIPHLTELNLTSCNGITIDGMRYLAAMKELRLLTLPCLGPTFDPDFPGLKAIKRSEYCCRYNDTGVRSLATSGVLGQLRLLSVVGVSDKSMKVISQCANAR